MSLEPGIIRDAIVINFKRNVLAYISDRKVIAEKTITKAEGQKFRELIKNWESAIMAGHFVAWISPVIPKELIHHIQPLVDMSMGIETKSDQVTLGSPKDYPEMMEYWKHK